MEQTNSLALNMLQTVAGQAAGIPKTTGRSDSDGTSDFQKLLDKKAQEKDPLVEEPAKTPAKTQTTVKKAESTTPQKQENALERAKKLAEQGAWFTQPTVGYAQIDFETGETIAVYQPGEYVLAHLNGQTEAIPVAGLEPWEQLQLQQLLTSSGQTIDVSDPEADAILAATAPGADNSPAALLEQVVNDEVGQVAQQVVAEAQPQDQKQDDDTQVELVDVEQAPQRLFHDVKAAPVKVGETYDAEQTDEADVVRQVENQVAQAIQRGDSTVTVKLNPENLGEVTVQVTMKSDGILNVAISARSDDTRALLERHSANLQELLSSRVRESVEVNVQREQESQQSQNQQNQNYDGHNGHAQEEQQERRRQRGHTSSQDFVQQLRLGLIPTEGEA